MMRVQITGPDSGHGNIGDEMEVDDVVGNRLICAGLAQRVGGKYFPPPADAPKCESPADPSQWVKEDNDDTE